MSSCMGCCASNVHDEELQELTSSKQAGDVSEEPLLEDDKEDQIPETSMLKKYLGPCCCILFLGLIGAGIYMWVCVSRTMAQDSIVLPLVEAKGVKAFGLSNMSTIPTAKWKELSETLTEHFTWSNYSFGYADPNKTAKLLYEGSKVSGVFEKMPQKLRGVWWMKGNPLPEVLAVLHYAMWFEEEQTLLVPNSPWTWAWWGGTSDQYPEGLGAMGRAVYSFVSGKSLATSYTDTAALDTTVSFVFEECPGGAVCEEGTTDFTYAKLMSHADGDLSKHGMVYYDGYTMEQADASEGPEGSVYFRRAEIFCGLFGGGSGYELTRIIDGDGEEVEPHFSDYIKFMASRPLIMWTGLPESEAP